YLVLFFTYSSGSHRPLHSFPTRRSSDLVLLKNERDLLPLAADVSLAVIGPLADSEADMIGSWSAAGEREERPVTLLEGIRARVRSEEHTSELQSRENLVCRLLLEKKKKQ